MMALLPKLVFTVDAVMVALAAWLCLCAAGLGRRGLIETSLGWLLLALAWIAGSGALLGMVGGLGRAGFLSCMPAAWRACSSGGGTCAKPAGNGWTGLRRGGACGAEGHRRDSWRPA